MTIPTLVSLASLLGLSLRLEDGQAKLSGEPPCPALLRLLRANRGGLVSFLSGRGGGRAIGTREWEQLGARWAEQAQTKLALGVLGGKLVGWRGEPEEPAG